MNCEALFQPFKIRSLSLKNRVIMGSMHVGLEGLENGLEKLTAFYEKRAAHDVGLIVTGGAAVNAVGSGGPDFMSIYDDDDIERWAHLTQAIHKVGGAIALQLFHAGRYAYKDVIGQSPVAPSPLKSPINPDTPEELTHEDIEKTINDFATGAWRAKKAGFDAVEIMGSEGYLINQFVSPVTNKRTDHWGGSFKNRLAFPTKIVTAVRDMVGEHYPIFFRMSGLDLIDSSTTEAETLQWAQAMEAAGADVLNVGIGWHESQIPTISMKVPRMHFLPVAESIAEVVSIPVVASNRINDPQDAAAIIEKGKIELISMARPFLADPALLSKAKIGRFSDINTCIACNQACLDHVFEGKTASCLVNPEAGRETELHMTPATIRKRLLIIGAGPAGLEAARVAAKRGHHVILADDKPYIGGQLNFAKLIPGKQEFNETLRYYKTQLDQLNVELHLNTHVDNNSPLLKDADEIIVATGIIPRKPHIKGIDDQSVPSYRDLFEGRSLPSHHVTIIGGGGIACDLALFLKDKGVETITLLQRSTKFARGTGKTTRWATLKELKQAGVEMIGGISSYDAMTADSITFTIENKQHTLSDTMIVLAAGQLPNDVFSLQETSLEKPFYVIGGAKNAQGLDAKNAIYEGTLLGRSL
ncbi:FAD-dependent oxidoreductase [Bacillus sp. A301a_S52]|nr:FAD-dependent oxidoreductase [Bacillus sp. A301a_S52]